VGSSRSRDEQLEVKNKMTQGRNTCVEDKTNAYNSTSTALYPIASITKGYAKLFADIQSKMMTNEMHNKKLSRATAALMW
jgi:hypothetical protein